MSGVVEEVVEAHDEHNGCAGASQALSEFLKIHAAHERLGRADGEVMNGTDIVAAAVVVVVAKEAHVGCKSVSPNSNKTGNTEIDGKDTSLTPSNGLQDRAPVIILYFCALKRNGRPDWSRAYGFPAAHPHLTGRTSQCPLLAKRSLTCAAQRRFGASSEWKVGGFGASLGASGIAEQRVPGLALAVCPCCPMATVWRPCPQPC